MLCGLPGRGSPQLQLKEGKVRRHEVQQQEAEAGLIQTEIWSRIVQAMNHQYNQSQERVGSVLWQDKGFGFF